MGQIKPYCKAMRSKQGLWCVQASRGKAALVEREGCGGAMAHLVASCTALARSATDRSREKLSVVTPGAWSASSRIMTMGVARARGKWAPGLLKQAKGVKKRPGPECRPGCW